MEDIDEKEQEEISISNRSTSKTSTGEILISCDQEIYSHDHSVLIRVSSSGKGKTISQYLSVGEAVEYQGVDEYFYKITLLTIKSGVINVLVNKSKLSFEHTQNLPESPAPTIQESETSRKRIFQELVAKHCPNLPKCKYEYGHSFLYIKEKRVFKSNTIFYVSIIRERHDEGLFTREWNDIEIIVYNPIYLDNMIKVAREYLQLTCKNATVVRSF